MNEELKNKLAERFNSVYGEEVKIGLRDALRKVYIDGAEHGYQYAVEKYERLIKNQLEQDISLGYANSFIDDLRKAMEE